MGRLKMCRRGLDDASWRRLRISRGRHPVSKRLKLSSKKPTSGASNFMSGWQTRLGQSLEVQLGLQTLKTWHNASKPSFLLLSKRGWSFWHRHRCA
uniref:Uncharacterized protein n=1 Tax=Picea sitchensis TaxID=3332 RepID=A9NQZ8_PICSI|nr:unknown [Picea sitchensis]